MSWPDRLSPKGRWGRLLAGTVLHVDTLLKAACASNQLRKVVPDFASASLTNAVNVYRATH